MYVMECKYLFVFSEHGRMMVQIKCLLEKGHCIVSEIKCVKHIMLYWLFISNIKPFYK